jgi:actin-like ATPase involved in cell morphogenesis
MALPYVLGIDLGTSYSAAAIDENGKTEIVQLGSRAAVVPSVVVLRADGEVLTGEAAERRSQSEPARTAREFKRRLGDPTPLILGGTPYGAESVTGLLLKAVVERVVEQRGEPPALVAITHPASYGPYKIDLLQQAVRQADIGETVFLSEPEAAALHYAGQERIEPGTVVAVYDFGGGTFDASVLRKTADGFELLGQPEGMERLGGIDFDEAIFQHVLSSVRAQADGLDANSPAVQTALARVREECREAKEALSADTEAVIPVTLPNLHTEVRITRAEFESIVTPRIRETVGALERSVRSAGRSFDDIDRILLVGGTSRIPLVGALVRELTGRPVALDAHPKHAVALGAAAEAQRRLPALAASPVLPAPAAAPLAAAEPPEPIAVPVAPVAPPVQSGTGPSVASSRERPSSAPQSPTATGGNRRTVVLGLAAVAVAGVAAVAAFLLFGGGSDDPEEASAADATATATLPAGSTPSPAATTADQPTATPTLAPNTSRITAIEVAGANYSVTFETGGFTPQLPGQHVHFFFDTVPPAQAGIPAAGPWFVYGGGSPFTGFALSDRPSGANQMCILVANPDHSVIQGTGNCMPLPR